MHPVRMRRPNYVLCGGGGLIGALGRHDGRRRARKPGYSGAGRRESHCGLDQGGCGRKSRPGALQGVQSVQSVQSVQIAIDG